MTVIRHMKTAAEDREVGVLLRNFDRAAARLAVLGVDVFKLREYVPADIHRGAVEALREIADPPMEDDYSAPREYIEWLRDRARQALASLGGQS